MRYLCYKNQLPLGEIFYYYYEDNKIEKIKSIIKQNNHNSTQVSCKFLRNSIIPDEDTKQFDDGIGNLPIIVKKLLKLFNQRSCLQFLCRI